MTYPVKVAVGPAGTASWVEDAVSEGGGEVVEASRATALVWSAARDRDGLARMLERWPHLDWVQVPFAGVENFIDLVDDSRQWTCGKGVYAEPVAEHAVALALAGLRHVAGYARLDSWGPPIGRNLLGARVTILGGGGIAESLIRLLQGFSCRITVVRREPTPLAGAEVVGPDGLDQAIADVDVVFLALALTDQTRGIITRRRLSIMGARCWLVNVARGAHIVTDDLVWALENAVIAGAALDVTDPEPLPVGHRLWGLDNCIITPHVGNTPEMAVPLLSERIRTNVERYGRGEGLIGRIDPQRGY